jgi:hypothetical protein
MERQYLYIQGGGKMLSVKFFFNNHNIINDGCSDPSSYFILSMIFRLLFAIRVFGVDPSTVHARFLVYKIAL